MRRMAEVEVEAEAEVGDGKKFLCDLLKDKGARGVTQKDLNTRPKLPCGQTSTR